MGKDGPEDDLGTFVDRLLRDLARAGCIATIVFDQQLQVRDVEFSQRHLGGATHGGAGRARVSACREWKNEPDFHLASAYAGAAFARLGWCRRRAGERVARRHPGARGQQGTSQHDGQPPRCSPVHCPCRSQHHHALCTIWPSWPATYHGGADIH